MNKPYLVLRAAVTACCCLASCASSWAADSSDMEKLKRAIEALRAENRELSERLTALEAQRPEPSLNKGREQIEDRINELEMAKDAQEDAVRRIIRDSMAKVGSKITESASLSGTLGVTIGRSSEFTGEKKSTIGLSTADFEFTIQPNEWAIGQIKLEYVDGKDVLFQTSTDRPTSVDRINLDTAFIAIGNQHRFPPLLSVGRMVLPFGISTGHPVADVLSVNSPLTVDAFEMRSNAISLNLAFPTPAVAVFTPPVNAPPVKPVAIYPLVAAIGRGLGYLSSPTRPLPLAPVSFTPDQAPFSAGIYIYEGQTTGGLRKHFGGTLGLHAKGNCGHRYEDLTNIGLCPWGLNVDLGYNSSVFNSRFLETEYTAFLGQIARIPGMSASLKSNLGPFSLVGEWNGALSTARFTDDLGHRVVIKPTVWQLSLGYQFDWNPWVQEIGAQGTYLAVGYSESHELIGATQMVNGGASRVGLIPRRRLLLTAGEWVQEGLRLTIEYARNWDYAIREGGTGKASHGLASTLTYTW